MLAAKRLLAFLFSVLFVDSLIAIHPQKAMQIHFWKTNCWQLKYYLFSDVPHNHDCLLADSLGF
jgi:hypothetical protein